MSDFMLGSLDDRNEPNCTAGIWRGRLQETGLCSCQRTCAPRRRRKRRCAPTPPASRAGRLEPSRRSRWIQSLPDWRRDDKKQWRADRRQQATIRGLNDRTVAGCSRSQAGNVVGKKTIDNICKNCRGVASVVVETERRGVGDRASREDSASARTRSDGHVGA